MALMPVDEALGRVTAGVKPVASETVKLSAALGRVLAKDLKAGRDQPPFPASAMDGYAVRHADLASIPVNLALIGMSAAGHAFRGRVKDGEAVRIFTGAPLPAGADTIVIQENTEAGKDSVLIKQASRPGQHVRARGLDFRKGEVLLHAGQTLNARDLGIAAAMNLGMLPVRRKPRVAILSTGDELVLPGSRPRADQIVSSNSAALAAFIAHFGGEAKDFGIVRDTLPATVTALKKAKGYDIVITSGGASVGDHDHVHEAFRRSGIRLGFWKIAMRPGKPLLFGTKGRQRILGLPGNPVSALVCARLFLKPLLDAFLGRPPEDNLIPARLGTALPPNDTRQDYVRARLTRAEDGALVATPFTVQDSSMQRTLAEAAAFIVRPPHAPAAEPGSVVSILPVDF
jgi:molybdopterin molybdotransferase